MNTLPVTLTTAAEAFQATTAEAYVAALPVTAEGIAARVAVQLFDQAYFDHTDNVWMRLPSDSPYWVEDRGNHFMRTRVEIALKQIAVLEAGVLAAMDRSPAGQIRALDHEEAGRALMGTAAPALILELTAELLDRKPDLDF